MGFLAFFELWNQAGKGWLKTHRLLKPLLNNQLLIQRFKESNIELQEAEFAIAEVIYLMKTDDFWSQRRRKQGIPWFFQKRGGGNEGEENWAWFYDHRINRLELEEEKKTEHNNVFKFEAIKELP